MASKGLQSFSKSLRTLRAFNNSSKDPLTVCSTSENLSPLLNRISSNVLSRDSQGQWQQKPPYTPKIPANMILLSSRPLQTRLLSSKVRPPVPVQPFLFNTHQTRSSQPSTNSPPWNRYASNRTLVITYTFPYAETSFTAP
jgi:hypothetical protein